MTYPGTVQNGVVVLTGGATLPEGTIVTVVPASAESAVTPEVTVPPLPTFDASMSIGEKLAALALWSETFPTDLPTDLARNHDHYLHGLPKKP